MSSAVRTYATMKKSSGSSWLRNHGDSGRDHAPHHAERGAGILWAGEEFDLRPEYVPHLVRSPAGRQGVVVKLRHTPHDLAHCRRAAWAFLVCLNATGHDRASQFPPKFRAYASFTTMGICPNVVV
jgi:hypothetical protein